MTIIVILLVALFLYHEYALHKQAQWMKATIQQITMLIDQELDDIRSRIDAKEPTDWL